MTSCRKRRRCVCGVGMPPAMATKGVWGRWVSGRTAGRRSRSWLLKITFRPRFVLRRRGWSPPAWSPARISPPSPATSPSTHQAPPSRSPAPAGKQASACKSPSTTTSDDAWSHEAEVTAAADGTRLGRVRASRGRVRCVLRRLRPQRPVPRSASFTVTAPPIPSAPTGHRSDSDEEEYEAGATVTLTGSNWTAGDTVHLAVDDDGDDAWEHATDVTVADDGIDHRHASTSPTTSHAEFTATATDPSDRSATATFTTSASQPTGSATEPYLVRFASGTSYRDAGAGPRRRRGPSATSYIAPLRIHAVLLPGGTALQTSARQAPLELGGHPGRARPHPRGRRHAERLELRRPVGAAEDRLGQRLRTSRRSGSAKVAILDTGIDGSHPDLDGNVVAGHVDPRRLERPQRPERARHGDGRASSRPRRTTAPASPASATPASR